MDRKTLNERATSNVLAWSTYGANVEPLTDEEEGGADADEPPDRDVPSSPFTNNFKRTTVSKKVTTEPGLSLLTKALQSHSEEETEHQAALNASKRRRSINSNISFASTTELTSDTGITTPARTSSPSPRPLPAVAFAPIPTEALRKLSPKRDGAPRSPSKATRIAGTAGPCKDPAIQALEKKRCISFACAAQPTKEALATLAAAASKPATAAPTPAAPTPAVAEPVKRPCIKFACPTRPTTTQSTPPKQQTIPAQKSPATGAHLSSKERSPSA
ncbi:MAG: hypothetical protein OK454_08070, partial [Thaumarchaeota archaeon]|nr:hypothetical protein [Nitrososphaerota archaeon]